MTKPTLNDIRIRTTLESGDLGYVIHMHGRIYKAENDYGLAFESYVAEGLAEFYKGYDPNTNRAWVCEHGGKIIGFMVLMNRGKAAQLRYFIIEPGYRGIGLGKKLMTLFMDFLKSAGYNHAYLWTTEEQLTATRLYGEHGFVLTEEKDSPTLFGKPLREMKFELHFQKVHRP